MKDYLLVPIVPAVQTVQALSLTLSRVAGEERGGGLNGAKRLNGWNGLNLSSISRAVNEKKIRP
jgi:hypothetical protein